MDQNRKTLAAQRLKEEEFALPKVEMDRDAKKPVRDPEQGLKMIQSKYNSSQMLHGNSTDSLVRF